MPGRVDEVIVSGGGTSNRTLRMLLRETLQDFGPIYAGLKDAADVPIEAVLPSDHVFTRGDQAYAGAGGRFAKKL